MVTVDGVHGQKIQWHKKKRGETVFAKGECDEEMSSG